MEYGKSVFVQSQGWAVFGRLGNELQYSQLLPSLKSDWKEGPPLILDEKAHNERQCIVQVNFLLLKILFYQYIFTQHIC